MDKTCLAPALWIAATDTNVGKSHLASALLFGFGQLGLCAKGWKPVQSGFAVETPVSLRDSEWVALHSGQEVLSGYSLPEPLSPHLAAERAGIVVDIDALRMQFADLRSQADIVLAEGAGGVLSPLSRSVSQMEFLQSLGVPVLCVMRSGLGTVNHGLLTLEALERRGISVAGFVFAPDADVSDWLWQDNADYIAHHSGVPFWGRSPQWPSQDGAQATALARKVCEVLHVTLD